MTTQVDTPQSRCRFGLARCDVTPPVGIYHRMWGAATHDRSTGVHRPLTATALALGALSVDHSLREWSGRSRSERTTLPDEQFLIALDHCLLWAREMDALRDVICTANDLAREQVVVAFSHTHGAGMMDAGRASLPGGELIPPYLDELGRSLAALVGEARRGMRPVTITYGAGRCEMAANRDFYDDASGQWVCGFNPEGTADDMVLVARVTDDADAPVATVVNYACHPTTLAWENTLISPDYVGALRETVERASGVPCAFLLGACGEIGPREGFVGDPAVADRNGRQVGYAALSVLESLPPPRTRFEYTGPVVSGATLGTWCHRPLDADALRAAELFRVARWTVPLPYPPGRPTRDQLAADRQRWQSAEAAARATGDEATARDCRAMVERTTRALTRERNLPPGETFPYPVTLCRVGGAMWLTLEGEPYQRIQTDLRRRLPGVPLMVAVIANGSRCSYLPPAELYGTGLYQESIAVLAPGCLEQLIENVAAHIATII